MSPIYSKERVRTVAKEEAARLGVASDTPEALQAAADRLGLALKLVKEAVQEEACEAA